MEKINWALLTNIMTCHCIIFHPIGRWYDLHFYRKMYRISRKDTSNNNKKLKYALGATLTKINKFRLTAKTLGKIRKQKFGRELWGRKQQKPPKFCDDKSCMLRTWEEQRQLQRTCSRHTYSRPAKISADISKDAHLPPKNWEQTLQHLCCHPWADQKLLLLWKTDQSLPEKNKKEPTDKNHLLVAQFTGF